MTEQENKIALPGIAAMVGRFNESCAAYDAAKKCWGDESSSRYEQSLRKSIRESAGALEQSARVYLERQQRSMTQDERDKLRHCEFSDLLNLFQKYAKPPLSSYLLDWCLQTRTRRNYSEHHSSPVPPEREVAEAIRNTRKIITRYFPEIDSSTLARCSADCLPLMTAGDYKIAKKTHYLYRDQQIPLASLERLVHHLEERYQCDCLSFVGRPIPITILWRNDERLVSPDQVLGRFDFAKPTRFSRSQVLPPEDYGAARNFIKRTFEAGPIKYEGCEYRMTRIDTSGEFPSIMGAFGYYYDVILTQYALEWELTKALLEGGSSPIDSLRRAGTLPLREAIEAETDPLTSGDGRCAGITVSTLLVFKRRIAGLCCLVRRRSHDVGVSPGMLHVTPAGMFEATNTDDKWSIELNVWRELLEEVYNDESLLGSQFAENLDYVFGREPVATARRLIDQGVAEFSVTGIVCDLLNLRPEVCTILYIPDPEFVEKRSMQVNWEYLPESRSGKFALDWNRVDELLKEDVSRYGIVPSGAACITLGREWVRRRHTL